MANAAAVLQTSVSAVAALPRRSFAELPIGRDIERFVEHVVEDLPDDDLTGRLERRQYVIDRLKLEFSKDAARLAAEFATDDSAGNRLDAPTAGEWIRHNCKTTSSVAYDSINVGEQLHRLPQCADAVADGLTPMARTRSAIRSPMG